MSIYEVTTEDGSVYEVTTEDAPADTSVTWGDALKQAGKNVLTGAAGLGDLASYLNPLSNAQRITDRIMGRETPTLRGYVDKAIPETVGGTAARIVKAGQEASMVPVGGVVANALSGLGSQAAAEMFPESKAAPFVGALFGPAAAAVGGKVAKVATGAGKAFERASVGAGVKDYLKNQRQLGLLEDAETGEAVTRLKQAINEIGDTEGWGLVRTPEALQERVTTKLAEYGGKIGEMAGAADQQGIQATLPFANAQRVIGKATASKGPLKKAFDEFIDAFTDPTDGWDGTIKGLQRWSKDIRNLGFSGQAEGPLKANVGRALQRAIGQDLQTSIKTAMRQAGYSADEIERAFRGFSNYATVAPVVAEQVVKGEAGTLASTARGLLRTTGGALTTPAILGGLSGAALGGPIGFAAGVGLGSLASPTVGGQAGNVLKFVGDVGRAASGTVRTALPGAAVAAMKPTANTTRDNDQENKKKRAEKSENPVHEGLFYSGQSAAPALFSSTALGSDLAKLMALFGGAANETPTASAASTGSKKNGDAVKYAELVDTLAPKLKLAETPGGKDANAVSHKGARGLWQIMPNTWREWAPKVGVDLKAIHDPVANEKVGRAYLNWLLEQFGGDPALALAAYNHGIGNVQELMGRWGNSIADIYPALPNETQQYVLQILGPKKVA